MAKMQGFPGRNCIYQSEIHSRLADSFIDMLNAVRIFFRLFPDPWVREITSNCNNSLDEKTFQAWPRHKPQKYKWLRLKKRATINGSTCFECSQGIEFQIKWKPIFIRVNFFYPWIPPLLTEKLFYYFLGNVGINPPRGWRDLIGQFYSHLFAYLPSVSWFEPISSTAHHRFQDETTRSFISIKLSSQPRKKRRENFEFRTLVSSRGKVSGRVTHSRLWAQFPHEIERMRYMWLLCGFENKCNVVMKTKLRGNPIPWEWWNSIQNRVTFYSAQTLKSPVIPAITAPKFA